LQNKECRRFTIYPPAKFYPVHSWKDGIGNSETKKMMQAMQNATTIHLQDSYEGTKTNSMVIYRMAAKQHCPRIYKFAAEDFWN